MRVQVSPEAAGFVAGRGGRVWVWAARPLVCCAGAPVFMHAAVSEPAGVSGFTRLTAGDIEVWFRPPGGRLPDSLEIALHGRRNLKLRAYWEGCAYVL